MTEATIESPAIPANDLAMQTRCVHCKRGQYLPFVHDISEGKDPCPWCGEKSRPMTVDEYGAIMREYWGRAVIQA